MGKNAGMILILFLCSRENQYNAGERRQNTNVQMMPWVGDPGQILFPFLGLLGCSVPVPVIRPCSLSPHIIWDTRQQVGKPQGCGSALECQRETEDTPSVQLLKHREHTELTPLLGGDSTVVPLCSSSRRDAQEMSLHPAQSKHNVLPTTGKWKTHSEKNPPTNWASSSPILLPLWIHWLQSSKYCFKVFLKHVLCFLCQPWSWHSLANVVSTISSTWVYG